VRSPIPLTPAYQVLFRKFHQPASAFTQIRHPFHRSYVQSVFDSYFAEKSFPSFGATPIASRNRHDGASFGAYHAATSSSNILTSSSAASLCRRLQPPHFMDGMYDDNFYFNISVDYISIFALGLRPARLLLHSSHHRPGPGKLRPTYHFSGHPRAQGHPPFARQLGPHGRPRLALLEAPDARIHFALVLESFAGTDYPQFSDVIRIDGNRLVAIL